jgi:hypothetical protein
MTSADTITLQEAASLSSHERGLVVVSTLGANGTIQSSLVNAGVLAHPATGETILASVSVNLSWDFAAQPTRCVSRNLQICSSSAATREILQRVVRTYKACRPAPSVASLAATDLGV